MGGIVGVFNLECQDSSIDLKNILASLQSNDNDSGGLCIYHFSQPKFWALKDAASVERLLDNKNIPKARSGIGIVIDKSKNNLSQNFQPFVVDDDLALVIKGGVHNVNEVKGFLINHGYSFYSDDAAEAVSKLIHFYYKKSNDPVGSVISAMNYLKGGYFFIVLFSDCLVAAKDPNGIVPGGVARSLRKIVISSESCVCPSIKIPSRNFEELIPGEVLLINNEGVLKHGFESESYSPCSYMFSKEGNPSSVVHKKEIASVRVRLGKLLALRNPIRADYVVPVLDSGLFAGVGYSLESKIPFFPGLLKKKYSHDKGEDIDEYLPLAQSLKDKDIILIVNSISDDSELRRVIEVINSVGVKKIHVRVSMAPLLFSCPYGYDIGEDFVSRKKSTELLCQSLGVDSLIFNSIKDMREAIGINSCFACMNGIYPTSFSSKGGNKEVFDVNSTLDVFS